jgi:hypothetical protein
MKLRILLTTFGFLFILTGFNALGQDAQKTDGPGRKPFQEDPIQSLNMSENKSDLTADSISDPNLIQHTNINMYGTSVLECNFIPVDRGLIENLT